jgi:catechol 2,3-dioxygenase-like lactoylglutathione lyase family enzyme
MLHNITGLDHALIGVADLEAARKTYERLGFTTTPRGSHIGWGTANYCIMFDEDYVELLGIVDGDKETNGLDRQLEARGEGMLALAVTSDAPEKTLESLQKDGLQPSKLLDLKRNLELPEGNAVPEFQLIRLRVEGLAENGLFICHHLTPEIIRRPQWLTHANGAAYVRSMVVVVADPFAVRDYFIRLLGSLNVTVTDATVTVSIGRLSLIFVAEPDLDLLLPGLIVGDELPELPYIISMSVAVADIGGTAALLKKNGVGVQTISGAVLRVQPQDACGVVLEFVQAPPL